MTMSGICALGAKGVRQQGALRVTPRRGTALLFMSASPHNGSLLPAMWHGGCRVYRGEKWTVQKFKELPAADATIGTNEKAGCHEAQQLPVLFRWPRHGA